VTRTPGGEDAMIRLLEDRSLKNRPFAPPFLKVGTLLIAQTANILHYLGPRLGLAPKGDAGRLWLHQQQLTISDWLVEVHDVHHPIGSGLYYEDQKHEAKRRAADFRKNRLAKFLNYFESILNQEKNARRVTYVHLSLFQILEGLRYAFPRTMVTLERNYRRLVENHDRIAGRPRLAAYLSSERRIAFNEQDIFRHYPELDKS
jgi:glutathione S-transferase